MTDTIHKKRRTVLFYMYVFGVALLAAALPLSKYMMSVAQFYLGGVVLLEFYKFSHLRTILGNRPMEARIVLGPPMAIFLFIEAFIQVFVRFFSRKNLPAIVLASIFFLHIAGLANTSDYEYAAKDLRIKLPILILPIIFSVSYTLREKMFRHILAVFTAAVFIATLICTGIYVQGNYSDIRDISIFISHIRFSLLITFAIFILAYFIYKPGLLSTLWKFVCGAVLIWLSLYLLISVSFTGLTLLFVISALILLYFLFRKGNVITRTAAVVIIALPLVIGFFFIRNIYLRVYDVQEIDPANLEKTTAKGNPYWHNLDNPETENGNYVWIYIAGDELRKAWNKRSDLAYEGKDRKGQTLKFTLHRYLTSKGLRKDAEGLSHLTAEEIRHIEDGVASVVYAEKPAAYSRIYRIIWALKRYEETGNASGNSLLQRMEYWRASLGIIGKHWETGVGTGDLQAAFDEYYQNEGTSLEERFRWRSHNQYLAIFIGFGIAGLLWFLFALIYPGVRTRRFRDYYYAIFFIIITLSMLTEDTIETQAGATIFAYFSALLLFGREKQPT